MHNGQYVSSSKTSEEGWEDEQEISGETKKRLNFLQVLPVKQI